jgi:hypothetical protein
MQLLTDGGFIIGLIVLLVTGLIAWGRLSARQEAHEKADSERFAAIEKTVEGAKRDCFTCRSLVQRHHEDMKVHRVPEWEEQRWNYLGERLTRIENTLTSLLRERAV